MANDNQAQRPQVVVDVQTFFTLQMSQLDNNIADAEVREAESALEVAKAKKLKTQSILDFNIDQIEKQQKQTQQVQAPDKTVDSTDSKDSKKKSKLKIR